MSEWVRIERKGSTVFAAVQAPSLGEREAPSLAATLGTALKAQRGSRRFQVDLSAVQYMNSMGLGALIHAGRTAREVGIAEIVAFGLSQELADMFRLLHLDQLFELEGVRTAA